MIERTEPVRDSELDDRSTERQGIGGLLSRPSGPKRVGAGYRPHTWQGWVLVALVLVALVLVLALPTR